MTPFGAAICGLVGVGAGIYRRDRTLGWRGEPSVERSVLRVCDRLGSGCVVLSTLGGALSFASWAQPPAVFVLATLTGLASLGLFVAGLIVGGLIHRWLSPALPAEVVDWCVLVGALIVIGAVIGKLR